MRRSPKGPDRLPASVMFTDNPLTLTPASEITLADLPSDMVPEDIEVDGGAVWVSIRE